MILLFACNNTDVVIQVSQTDSSQKVTYEANTPKKTVFNFLKWYRFNNERINHISFIKGIGLDTITFYRIDFTQVNVFISEFQKSGFVSSAYINYLKAYFKKAEEDLVNHPQNDDVPIAFSSDLVMHTQEDLSGKSNNWDDILKSKATVEMLTPKKAMVTLDGYFKLQYLLSLVNNKWVIDSVELMYHKALF